MPNHLVDRLRERGYRLTAQRRVVAEVLDGANLHLTADEVHKRAAELLPEISRATVYNTVQHFAELGEVLELSLNGRSKHYDPNVSPPHHHLICDSCGSVHDVAFDTHAPTLDPTELHGMVIDSAEIVYHGTCQSCA